MWALKNAHRQNETKQICIVYSFGMFLINVCVINFMYHLIHIDGNKEREKKHRETQPNSAQCHAQYEQFIPLNILGNMVCIPI